MNAGVGQKTAAVQGDAIARGETAAGVASRDEWLDGEVHWIAFDVVARATEGDVSGASGEVCRERELELGSRKNGRGRRSSNGGCGNGLFIDEYDVARADVQAVGGDLSS